LLIVGENINPLTPNWMLDVSVSLKKKKRRKNIQNLILKNKIVNLTTNFLII